MAQVTNVNPAYYSGQQWTTMTACGQKFDSCRPPWWFIIAMVAAATMGGKKRRARAAARKAASR